MRFKHVHKLVAWAGVFLVVAVVAAPRAEAQPSCNEGTLTGDVCVIVGEPPVNGAARCPVSSTVFLDGSFCYTLIPRNGNGTCSAPAIADPNSNLCRTAFALQAGALQCRSGFTLVDESRCERYVDPVCGPTGCRGRITLNYTVTCVSDGVARLRLGTPKLENGARVSLITLNGSAVVGADIGGGTAVAVVVTPERSTDEVVVSGPTTAPSCAAAVPTVAATVVPTAVPTTAPRPTAVPQPTRVPIPTATAVATPSAKPTPAATSVPETPTVAENAPATRPTSPVEASIATSSITGVDVSECDVNGLVEVRLFSALDPPTSEAQVQWHLIEGVPSEPTLVGEHVARVRGDGFARSVTLATISPVGVADTTMTLTLPDCTAPATAASADLSTAQLGTTEAVIPVVSPQTDLPLVPLAAIGGATIVLAVAVYAGITRKQ